MRRTYGPSDQPKGPDHAAIAPPATPDDREKPDKRKLLVLDASFTFQAIRERGLEHTVQCRDLDGFFSRVWSVHPFATMLTTAEWAPPWGPPRVFELTSRHTFIEGAVGRHRALRNLFALNFSLAQIQLFFMLWRLIRREGIDVIRVGDPHYLGLFGWALSKVSGSRLVVRVGGNFDKIYADTGKPIQPRLLRSRKFEKRIERFIFKRADLVAGANQNNLDFALANGADRERSTLFRYGNLIDGRHFVAPELRPKGEPLAELGLPEGPFLLYIGRLVPEKYAIDLVRVVCELKGSGHSVRLVCAGDGPLREEMTQLAERLGVADLLILAGNMGQEWLAAALTAATVVVSPHTGRALTEAALAGTPIVAYDVDWQGELIHTDETGILVPVGDWRAMAAAVQRFLDDLPFAARMGAAGRSAALRICDAAALNEHERTEYAKVLAK